MVKVTPSILQSSSTKQVMNNYVMKKNVFFLGTELRFALIIYNWNEHLNPEMDLYKIVYF